MERLDKRISSKEPKIISTSPEAEKFPNVLFLGTASVCPSKVRNISSFIFHTNANQSIILDCGESTISQLNKYYANETVFSRVLCNTKAVFISHNHLDHYNGLYGIVIKRQEAFKKLNLPYEKLAVMYPRTLNQIFNTSYVFFESQREFLDLVDLIPNDSLERYTQVIKNYLNLRSFQTVLVDHIPHSYGCVIELEEPNR